MRTFPAAIGVLFLAACASAPQETSFVGIDPGGGGAMTCVTERLDNLGFQPVNAGSSETSVRMERTNDENFWLNMIGIEDSFDVIDVTAQGAQVQLVTYSELVRAGERQSAFPSDQSRRAAREAVEKCT